MTNSSIPQTWVRDYVDKLLELAARLPEGGMRQATLSRAEHAMDLVEAWRESCKRDEKKG